MATIAQRRLKFEERLIKDVQNLEKEGGISNVPLDYPNVSETYYQELFSKRGAFLADLKNRADEILVSFVCLIDGTEFVIVAAKSRSKEQNLTPEGLKTIEAFAKEKGCLSVRLSTMRAGMIYQTKKSGYRIAEVVMRKNLDG